MNIISAFTKMMSIRTKVSVIVFINILLLALIIYGVSTLVISRSYIDIERKDAIKNMDRVDDAIKNTATELSVKLADWAFWDDTYQFMTDKNEAYIKSNLNNASISNLKINAMVYVDTNKDVVLKKMIDYETLEDVSSDSIGSYITTHKNLVTFEDSLEPNSGLIILPEGPFIISASQILTSSVEGPVRGSLVFGKFLNDRVIQSLEKLTHISFKIYDINSTVLPADVADAKAQLYDGEEYIISPISNNVLAGYRLLKNINGEPVLILRTESGRSLYNQGEFTIYFFIVLTTLFIVLFGIVIIFFIEKFVISRLVILGKEVDGIGGKKDLFLRVKEGANDEIGKLAKKINGMLSALDSSKKIEMESMENMRLVGAELAERIEEIEKTNSLMLDRELKMIELKKELEVLRLKK